MRLSSRLVGKHTDGLTELKAGSRHTDRLTEHNTT